MANYGRNGQRAARIVPDRICRIRLPASVSVLFFQRRHGSNCAKPTRIRPGWPGQGLAKHINFGLEASWCAGIIGPGFWQDATGTLPVSHFQTRFRTPTDVPNNIVQNQSGSNLAPADCVRFLAKQIRPGSKPLYNNHPARFWPMLSSRSGPDANRIRHVYWDVTFTRFHLN